MKVILDGVFNHCGSFNKWLDREKIYDKDESYEKVLFCRKTVPITTSSIFTRMEAYRTIRITIRGGGNDTLPKLNYEGSERLRTIHSRSCEKMGGFTVLH